MSDRTPAVTDDMVERAAQALTTKPWCGWSAAARVALEAGLGGRAPVDLPEVVVNDPQWLTDTLWDSLNDSTNQGTDPYTYTDVERAVRDVVHEARRLAQQRPQRDLTEPSAGVENLTEPDRSPEAWVRRFKALPLVEQVVAARAVLENARRRWECDADAHRRWVREGREAGWLPPRPPILVTDSDGEGSETPR